MRKDRPEREVREKREKSENLYLTLLIYKIDLAKSMPLNLVKLLFESKNFYGRLHSNKN